MLQRAAQQLCFCFLCSRVPIGQYHRASVSAETGSHLAFDPLRGTEAGKRHVIWACQCGICYLSLLFFSLICPHFGKKESLSLGLFCYLCKGRKRHVGNSDRLWGVQHLGGALCLKWSPKITRTTKGEKFIRIINWFPSPSALET